MTPIPRPHTALSRLRNAAVTRLRTTRDQIKLRRLATAAPSTENLPRADDLDLSGLLAPGTSPSWEQASHLLEQLDVPDGTGGVNPGDRRALFSFATATAARHVLEIGTHIGASTLYLAASLASSGDDQAPSPAKLVTVDIVDVNHPDGPWRQAGTSATPRDLLTATGLSGQVEFVTASSLTYLAGDIGPFDLIFLDGSHRAHLVYAEIAAATRVLTSGGLIVLHDYYPAGRPLWPTLPSIPGPYLAVERHRAQGADLRAHPLGDLPWDTKHGSRTTSLAVLSRR